jgi:hypothetical protein
MLFRFSNMPLFCLLRRKSCKRRLTPNRERVANGIEARLCLHGMQHFHAEEVEMGATKHLALQKF